MHNRTVAGDRGGLVHPVQHIYIDHPAHRQTEQWSPSPHPSRLPPTSCAEMASRRSAVTTGCCCCASGSSSSWSLSLPSAFPRVPPRSSALSLPAPHSPFLPLGPRTAALTRSLRVDRSPQSS